MKNKLLTSIFPSLKSASDPEDRVAISHVVRPGAEAKKWEVWHRDSGTFTATIVDNLRLRKADFPGTVFCWSSRETLTLPVWVAEVGNAEEMVGLELEIRGLARPGEVPVFVLDEVLRENERRLFAVHLLKDANTICPLPQAGWCDIGVRWLPIEKDALHFWMEDGLVTYALSRGSYVVYAESLRTAKPTTIHLQNIQRVILRLQAEKVLIESISSVVFFDSVSPELKQSILSLFKIPCRKAAQSPVVPAVALDLPSMDAVHYRKKLRTVARVRRGVILAGAALLLAFLISGISIFRDLVELRRLEGRTAAHASEVRRLMSIARDWRIVEPALDSSFYPLDILRDCAAQLPDKGARMTIFSVDGPEVVIQGEAVNHPAAFSFAENIKKAPTLMAYAWELPQPTMLPNNTASFQMRGIRKTHETSEP